MGTMRAVHPSSQQAVSNPIRSMHGTATALRVLRGRSQNTHWCYASNPGQQSSTNGASGSLGTTTSTAPVTDEAGDYKPGPGELECFSNGLDVQCLLEPDIEDESIVSSSGSDITRNGIQGAPHPMVTVSSPQGEGAIERVLATALLVSPFFFWGTSMVAMKVRGMDLFV